jgi:hypothetical protein
VIFTGSVYSKRPYEENDLEATMKLNFLCNNGWMSNHKLFFENGIMKLPEPWQQHIEMQGEYVEKRYYFFKKTYD